MASSLPPGGIENNPPGGIGAIHLAGGSEGGWSLARDVDPSLVPRPLARLPTPLADFLHFEAAGGIVLVVAALVALLWANSPWQDGYHALWSTHLSISLGSRSIDLTL